MSFINELKRRNVIRVGFAYAVVGWVIAQVADLALDSFGAPLWVMKTLMFIILLGFIVSLFIAWAYEITPEGIKRESEVDRNQSVAPQTARKLDRMIILVLLLAVSLLLAQRYLFEPEPAQKDETNQFTMAEPTSKAPVIKPQVETTAKTENQASLAVLPFTNMSADPDNEYFADGISEELLNQLVKVKGLRVPSRTSSFAFKGKNTDIKEIARQLSVKHVLEGSVRKSGNQVRITAQLIDVSTDTHMWSETYDRTLDNIFAIQDEISREIVKQLKISLAGSGLLARDQNRPTENLQAYQDYLRGRYLYTQRGIPSLKASLEALQSAVALDPQFSQAWAALSLTAAILPGWDFNNDELYRKIAIDAGERALALDSQSETALMGLSMIYSNMGQWSKSQAFLDKIPVTSKATELLYLSAVQLQMFGNLQAARKRFLEAVTFDPVYPQLQAFFGFNAYMVGDYQTARESFQNAIAGDNFNGTVGMYNLSLLEGNIDAASKYLRELDQLQTENNIRGDSKQTVEILVAAFNDPALTADGIKAALASQDITALAYFGAEAEIMQLLVSWSKVQTMQINIQFFSKLWGPDFSKLRQRDDFKQLLRDTGLVAFWKTNDWPDLCKPVGKDDFVCE